MSTRIFNLAKWEWLKEGNAIEFHNTRRRTVVLDVNAPEAVRLYVSQSQHDIETNPEKVSDDEAGRRGPSSDGDRTVTFIGRVLGRDRLEFAVDGAFQLFAEGGEFYWYTIDSQDVSTKVVAPVIFTKIANRRERNPHLEMIEFQMRQNQRRFEAQMGAEMERRLAAIGEQYAQRRDTRTFVEAAEDRERRLAGDAGSAPEGAPDAGASGEDPGGPEDGSGEAPKRGGKKKAAA